MKIVLSLFILFLLCLFIRYVKIDYYTDTFQGSKILSDADKVECSHYTSFIEKPYNKAYYQRPRFVNPNKACEDECIYGVWNDNNKKADNEETAGSEQCCKKACKIIPEK